MKFNPRIASAGVVAIAMALGGGVANAATLTAVPVAPAAAVPYYFSQQGQALSGSTAAQTLPTISVTVGADYSVNDNITLRISGATVGGATDTNLNGGGIVCPGAPNPMILSYITRNGNDILLRVTQKNVVNTFTPTAAVCTIAGIQVTAPSLTSITNVYASWSATTAITNIPFDPSTSSLLLASVVDQFTTSGLVALNGIVDVNPPSLRTNFLTDDGGSFAGNEDRLTAVTNNGWNGSAITFIGPVAVLNSVVVTLTGSSGFNHVDNNTNNGTCSTTELQTYVAVAAGGGTVTGPASGCGSLTYSTGVQAAGSAVTHTLAFGPSGGELLAQSFTAEVRYNYGCGTPCGTVTTGTEADTVAAGSWTLNGFSAFVPYMPFDPAQNISQILYITNKSTQVGAVQIKGYNEAGVACNFAAGNAAAGSVTKLSDAVVSGFKGCYGNSFTGKVSFNVTAPIPGALAEVYSAYNVNGNRLTVINNSNGKAGGTYGGGNFNNTLGSGL